MNSLVLLIDEDRLPMRYYVKALERKGFRVHQVFNPDNALDFLKRRASDVGVIVLDIMMPPGMAYANENTNEGLKTGVFLLGSLKKSETWRDIPVVILTNVRNPDTLSECRPQLNHTDKLVQKMECSPFELAALVEEALEEHTRKSH